MKRRRIIVCIPRFATGGPLALYALASYMYEAGQDVRVFWYGPWRRVPGDDLSYFFYRALFNIVDTLKLLRAKILGPERCEKDPRYAAYVHPSMRGVPRKFLSSCRRDDIVVYPEEIYGNPLGARNVVRWLLYHNRHKGDKDAFGPDDQVICYRPVFNDEELNPLGRQCYVCHYDLSFYRRTNFGARSGTCYLIKKGAGRPDLPSEFDGPIIDGMSEREKVETFNSCERFVSYDTQTAYASLAVVCGCETIVIPEEGKTRADYVKGDDHAYGYAYGFSPEELAYAADTRDKVREQYLENNANAFANAESMGRWMHTYFDARDNGATQEELDAIDDVYFTKYKPDEKMKALYRETHDLA